jgi:hypothetical protein
VGIVAPSDVFRQVLNVFRGSITYKCSILIHLSRTLHNLRKGQRL